MAAQEIGEHNLAVPQNALFQIKRKDIASTHSSAIDTYEENGLSFHRRAQPSHYDPVETSFSNKFREEDQIAPIFALDAGLSPHQNYELHSVTSRQTLRDNGYDSEASLLLHQNLSPGEDGGADFPQYSRDTGSWYMPRLLVNRTLRGMTVCMVFFASLMLFTCISHIKALRSVTAMGSTSVPFNNNGGTESCKSLGAQSLILHLFINIAATMILGISNTYQQLVTSLKSSEIRWALSKFRDVRVGTNAPSNINRKKIGKGQAWVFWALLISTSLPVHLLANSIIGPALVYEAPQLAGVFASKEAARNHLMSLSDQNKYGDLIDSFGNGNNGPCWEAFRTGSLSWGFEDASDAYAFTFGYSQLNISRLATSNFSVSFEAECALFNGTGTYQDAETEYLEMTNLLITNPIFLGGSSCVPANDITCMISLDTEDSMPEFCRLQIRMSAALILMGCLIFKAAYMVFVNIKAWKVRNETCITWGDVVAASVVEPGLKIKNECMVNAGDSFRQRVAHVCHKHCRNGIPGDQSGDSLGHCQQDKCKKYNIIDRAADLPQPSLATKFKRPLLAGLGLASIGQIMILTTCSMVMLGFSIYLAIVMSATGERYKYECNALPQNKPDYCSIGLSRYLWQTSGEFGGFQSSITIASLQQDSFTSEIITFFISNGPQLLYSAIYLLLIYNISLISMEHDWGRLDSVRQRLRCTIFKGDGFDQSYFLQLPRVVLLPVMIFSSTMHWLLGQAISARENVYISHSGVRPHSQYDATFAMVPFWMATIFMLFMTGVCWWAFTFKREGFIPQMYGSMRVLCASTTKLFDFASEGVMWGEYFGKREARLAGFASGPVQQVQPNKFYPGVSHED